MRSDARPAARLAACLILLQLLTSCTGAPPGAVMPSAFRPETSALTAEYARFRAGQLGGVDYRLDISLSAEAPAYSATAEIGFDLYDDAYPLTVDFTGGTVHEVRLNGAVVPHAYNGWFISISPAYLDTGRQRLSIVYSHPYSSTGSGLYRFADPEDGRTYVYTDFEPYDANRLLPCFDQPDLKASFELAVEVPAAWRVISSVAESSVESLGLVRRWVFPRSARYSTYLFPLHAGDFHVWSAAASDIPLRLFARRSLAGYVEPETWFESTRRGLAFYQDYFNVDYPFGKYDQVIVPDFNAGAMENVAAVTFSERYVRRGEYMPDDEEAIANVILHEMAHMWFGDLVTMRWWNGLWLNESFATYMSYLAMADGSRWPGSWLRFYIQSKLWAYETDEQVTTHPIELPVEDTDGAFANFDGITYGKGASVLKQLSQYLGPENFQRGVSRYLQGNAWGNTGLEDFTGALAEAAGVPLEDWTTDWLYQAGLNSVSVAYDCAGGALSHLKLRQQGGRARSHRLQLGLYRRGPGGGVDLLGKQPVTLEGAETAVDAPAGTRCPDFIYPNLDDWAYIKVNLNGGGGDLPALPTGDFEDPLTRAMLWRGLWEAVRDAELPLTAYADHVLERLPGEDNPSIVRQLLATLDEAIDYLYQFGGDHRATAVRYGERAESLAWDRLHALAADDYLQGIWFDEYHKFVREPAALTRLVGLLTEDIMVPGLELDQDRRWELLEALSAGGHPRSAELIATEARRDPSQQGAIARIAAEAASPDPAIKARWLADIQAPDGLTLARRRAAMAALFPASQREARRRLLVEVLAPLPTLDQTRDPQYLRAYGGNLVKGYCSDESRSLLALAVDDNRGMTLNTTKPLRIALQEDERCIRLRGLLDERL